MSWQEAIQQPLGLAGFSLFLVLAYAAKRTNEETTWMRPLIAFMSCVALIGGLLLAFYPYISSESVDKIRSQSAPKSEKPKISTTGATLTDPAEEKIRQLIANDYPCATQQEIDSRANFVLAQYQDWKEGGKVPPMRNDEDLPVELVERVRQAPGAIPKCDSTNVVK